MTLYTNKDINQIQKLPPEDCNVFAIIDNKVKDYFSAFKNWNIFSLSASENAKSLKTATAVYSWLMENKADRNCFILGAGGGVTTDLAAFVASTYKRGVKFALVPTTLLAAADAAIGGKNGVNHLGVKNMIGTFTQPEWVFQSPVFFRTLDRRIFREGIAEILKTFLIFSPDLYGFAVSFFSGYNSVNPSDKEEKILGRIVKECARLKMEVVKKDEKDRGERMVLNLGHTFGHALESWASENRKKILHGEAVAAGIVLSAKVSSALGLCDKSFAAELAEDFGKVGLPTSFGVRVSQIFNPLQQDKKISSDNICLIVPKGIGDVVRLSISVSDLKKIGSRLSI